MSKKRSNIKLKLSKENSFDVKLERRKRRIIGKIKRDKSDNEFTKKEVINLFLLYLDTSLQFKKDIRKDYKYGRIKCHKENQ